MLKPGLHIVVTIAKHASDIAPKRILRLSIHRLQIFLVKCEYTPCEYQGIPGKLKKRVCDHMLAILTTWRPGLRGLYRQDFGAKFNLTYHNDAPVAYTLNMNTGHIFSRRESN